MLINRALVTLNTNGKSCPKQGGGLELLASGFDTHAKNSHYRTCSKSGLKQFFLLTKKSNMAFSSFFLFNRRHNGVINTLYEGTQCSSCGLRFPGEAAKIYGEHLDWHFRKNRREKDSRRVAHRTWYLVVNDWLDYEEISDPEERGAYILAFSNTCEI